MAEKKVFCFLLSDKFSLFKSFFCSLLFALSLKRRKMWKLKTPRSRNRNTQSAWCVPFLQYSSGGFSNFFPWKVINFIIYVCFAVCLFVCLFIFISLCTPRPKFIIFFRKSHNYSEHEKMFYEALFHKLPWLRTAVCLSLFSLFLYFLFHPYHCWQTNEITN